MDAYLIFHEEGTCSAKCPQCGEELFRLPTSYCLKWFGKCHHCGDTYNLKGGRISWGYLPTSYWSRCKKHTRSTPNCGASSRRKSRIRIHISSIAALTLPARWSGRKSRLEKCSVKKHANESIWISRYKTPIVWLRHLRCRGHERILRCREGQRISRRVRAYARRISALRRAYPPETRINNSFLLFLRIREKTSILTKFIYVC